MNPRSNTRLSGGDRLLALALKSSLRFEELAARVDRRLVVKAAIPVMCLFLLVGIVGSWHSKLRGATTTTDAVWTIVVTTYKVALVAFVLLLVVAFVGAAYRKRQQAPSGRP
jgi:ABC-type Fe3+ transport system permease subunit